MDTLADAARSLPTPSQPGGDDQPTASTPVGGGPRPDQVGDRDGVAPLTVVDGEGLDEAELEASVSRHPAARFRQTRRG